MSTSQQYHVVNGAQLPSFIGSNVAVFGMVTKNTSSGNTTFQINTTDNLNLTVQLNKPLSNDLHCGYVEVMGKCESVGSNNIIKATEFCTFSNESFDAKSHNTLCKLINSTPNVYHLEN